MNGLDNHVSLVITADSVGVARAGFGMPLVLSPNAPWPERLRLYSRLADVISDGFPAGSPEALAAGAMFGQSPHPRRVAIGRAANRPTQRYTLSVIAPVRSLFPYQVRVSGPGFGPVTQQFISGAGATDAQVVAGLVAALNAVPGRNYTAAGAASPFTVTLNTPGAWASVEVLDPTALSVRQDHADPGVAADLAAIQLENDDWYWLYTLYNSELYVTAAATWAQGARKLYIADSNDTRDLGASTGTAGTLDVLKAAGRAYVAGDYHPSPASMSGAAMIGGLAPRTPGSWTAKFKRRAGVPPVKLTPTQRANLIARNANFYETVAGVNITSEGTTSAGPSDVRGFIDNVVSLDWQENDMASAVFGDMASADKIPRTDAGMVVIKNAMSGSLKRGIANGVVAELSAEQPGGPSPRVDVPLVADMADLLPRGVRAAFSFKLAGAVHHADINGVVLL